MLQEGHAFVLYAYMVIHITRYHKQTKKYSSQPRNEQYNRNLQLYASKFLLYKVICYVNMFYLVQKLVKGKKKLELSKRAVQCTKHQAVGEGAAS